MFLSYEFWNISLHLLACLFLKLLTIYSHFASLDQFSYIAPNFIREYFRLIIRYNFPVAIDQKLSKVPWNFTGLLFLRVVQRWVWSKVVVCVMSILSIHFNLLCERELDTILSTSKGIDFFGGTWLLTSKLVAREPDDGETLWAQLVMHLN